MLQTVLTVSALEQIDPIEFIDCTTHSISHQEIYRNSKRKDGLLTSEEVELIAEAIGRGNWQEAKRLEKLYTRDCIDYQPSFEDRGYTPTEEEYQEMYARQKREKLIEQGIIKVDNTDLPF